MPNSDWYDRIMQYGAGGGGAPGSQARSAQGLLSSGGGDVTSPSRPGYNFPTGLWGGAPAPDIDWTPATGQGQDPYRNVSPPGGGGGVPPPGGGGGGGDGGGRLTDGYGLGNSAANNPTPEQRRGGGRANFYFDYPESTPKLPAAAQRVLSKLPRIPGIFPGGQAYPEQPAGEDVAGPPAASGRQIGGNSLTAGFTMPTEQEMIDFGIDPNTAANILGMTDPNTPQGQPRSSAYNIRELAPWSQRKFYEYAIPGGDQPEQPNLPRIGG